MRWVFAMSLFQPNAIVQREHDVLLRQIPDVL